MRKEILDELYKPFELKARPGQGNQTFKYVPSDDIVDRMNKVFMGDWSTEVVEKEVVEDQILIRVRVYAQTDTGMYWQEGYASQFIARFTQGPKSGKIIDIGNSYKSAMSKAIKTAVAKWGVGLYLEKGSANEESPAASWEPPNISTAIPEAKPVATPTLPVPPVAVPVAVPVVPMATPVNIPSGAPEMPFNIPTSTPPVEKATPPFSDDNLVVTQPNIPTGFNPPVDSVPTSGGVENLTDVQKAAIENIMSVHGKSFAELSSAALQRTDNLPTAAEALSYQDAVKLIQYGNNLNANS